MATYFKTDSRRVTLREYWNILPSWKSLIPWIAGRLNIAVDLSAGFRLPESVAELEVPEAAFSPQARTKLRPLLDQCLQLGFHSPRCYTFANLRGNTHVSFISLLHGSGEIAIRLIHCLSTQVMPARETSQVVLLSELAGGNYFFTTDQTEKFRNPPEVTGERLVGAPLAQLVAAHQQSLARMRTVSPPRPLASLAALDELSDRYERLCADFGIQRGLYVPMTEEEVAAELRRQEVVNSAGPVVGEHAAVLAELARQQERTGGWGNALILLVVTLLLFVGVGSRQWNWEYVLMLVPILFIHELGHYLAMRAFDYRNLRMFFIPFFGAAVSGQNYNVPGWKKVVVSLMGPVPGIVIGVLVGGAGVVLSQPWLIKLAIVALFLNGFNLLPVLPFDGGWVFHTLIFSRHYLLDTGFRVAATLGLMAIGMFSQSKLLVYLGIPMLFGIPAAHRLARITQELRARGLAAASPDNQTIPTETAVAIIAELQKGQPPGLSTKLVAQQTLQVFEALNARPPGWLATGALLFTYVASLGMAIVFAVVLFAVRQGG